MMRAGPMLRAIALACLIPVPAMAELPLTAAEFEAYVTNKTITWDYGAGVLGAEQYLPGRQVRWAFQDEQCMMGTWFEDSGNICFVYEDGTGPQCWRFERGSAGLRAQFIAEGGGTVITEIGSSPEPLACSGPEVGV
jgi:hypothetical protein